MVQKQVMKTPNNTLLWPKITYKWLLIIFLENKIKKKYNQSLNLNQSHYLISLKKVAKSKIKSNVQLKSLERIIPQRVMLQLPLLHRRKLLVNKIPPLQKVTPRWSQWADKTLHKLCQAKRRDKIHLNLPNIMIHCRIRVHQLQR